MSSNSIKYTATVVACLVAFAGFLAISVNPPTEAKITEEQAINILKTRAQHQGSVVNTVTVWSGTLVSAELRYAELDWSTYLDGYPHTDLYINASTPKGPEPYWFLEYSYASNNGMGATYEARALGRGLGWRYQCGLYGALLWCDLHAECGEYEYFPDSAK